MMQSFVRSVGKDGPLRHPKGAIPPGALPVGELESGVRSEHVDQIGAAIPNPLTIEPTYAHSLAPQIPTPLTYVPRRSHNRSQILSHARFQRFENEEKYSEVSCLIGVKPVLNETRTGVLRVQLPSTPWPHTTRGAPRHD
jgi:hypothetical protein